MSGQIQKVAIMLPVADLHAAAKFWSELLETPATFVDGERWAQFDFNGTRLALAGTDRVAEVAGVMLKVGDVGAVRSRVIALGLAAEPIVEGVHETRCSMAGPGGWPVVFYAPRP